MFRAHCVHHRERKIVSIQPLVSVTDTECQIPEVVLIQFVSPDDKYNVLERCSLFVFLPLQPTVVVFSQPGSGI
jgi:hypothetical protein